jgi:hypothetical protein
MTTAPKTKKKKAVPKKPRTKKQRLFFKELLEASSGTEAARRAGYSGKSAGVSAHRNIRKYNEFMLATLVKAGVDIDSISSSLKGGLKSKDLNTRFRYLQLSLKLIEKVLSHEEVDAIQTTAVLPTVEEEAIRKLNFALRVSKYTGMAFIKREDLPSDVTELKPEEIIQGLGIKKKIAEAPNSKGLSLLDHARLRMPSNSK